MLSRASGLGRCFCVLTLLVAFASRGTAQMLQSGISKSTDALVDAPPAPADQATPPAAQQLPLPTNPEAAPPPPVPALKGNFFQRLGSYYWQDWHGKLPASPPSPRRAPPAPLDSPPFPGSDWSYGGSSTIGTPDPNSYPLMTAINGANSRSKIWGWIEPSVNGSTSDKSNSPTAYDAYANRLEMDQIILYAERLPDTVQTSHIDWGYHLTAFYGTDYRYTLGKGYFSDQFLVHSHQYGFDPIIEYFELYLPHVARGMNLRFGRFISVPGIEAQLAPNNYIFSHSLLYSIDPFSDTGVMATIKFNDQWILQLGITGGHDVALWTPDAQPSGTICANYTSKTVNDNIYLCANGFNDAQYAYNNVQQYDATWYHKFSKSWHMASEGWFMYELNVPGIYGPIKPELGANGATCLPGEPRCTAPEYAFVNYIQKEVSTNNFISFRSDFLNDKKGQRTGYATKYTENSLMWSHWIGSTVQIRPEIRFDHAWDRNAYDNGTHQNQFTIASDLIFHF